MKKIITLLVLINSFCAKTKSNEFNIYNSGLIYDDSTMKQLHFIVDSLNLKFKQCSINSNYKSVEQTIGYRIISEKNVKKIKQSLNDNLPIDEIMKLYPNLILDTCVFIINNNDDDETKDRLIINCYSIDNDFTIYLEKTKREEVINKKKCWLVEYRDKSEYSKESVEAIFLHKEFSSNSITEKYAKLIQYSDCMIDTNATIFFENAKENYRYENNTKSSKKVNNFIDLVTTYPNKPVYDSKYEESTYSLYIKNYNKWDSLKDIYIRDTLSKTDNFKIKLQNALDEALKNGNSDDLLEYYVGQYISKEKELYLKRNRIVVGGCSMDSRPRTHAFNIAILAAETKNWEIFLRAHLNIMNDRFNRVSDGSWAWKSRNTYIKEIEDLGINVPDLLIGICLRFSNPNKNHYYANVGRIGRAFAESNYKNEIEEKIISSISDNNLDYFNRMILYYLFSSYNNYLSEDEKDRKDKNQLIIKTLSSTLQTSLLK